MEENIKILKELVQFGNDRDILAIENILGRLEQLEKENKKLTEARNWYFEHTVNKAVTPEMLHKILREDYVPKSVIREKIEEFKKYGLKRHDYSLIDMSTYKIITYEQALDELKEELIGGSNE